MVRGTRTIHVLILGTYRAPSRGLASAAAIISFGVHGLHPSNHQERCAHQAKLDPGAVQKCQIYHIFATIPEYAQAKSRFCTSPPYPALEQRGRGGASNRIQWESECRLNGTKNLPFSCLPSTRRWRFPDFVLSFLKKKGCWLMMMMRARGRASVERLKVKTELNLNCSLLENCNIQRTSSQSM
jgi:hypothetical protein